MNPRSTTRRDILRNGAIAGAALAATPAITTMATAQAQTISLPDPPAVTLLRFQADLTDTGTGCAVSFGNPGATLFQCPPNSWNLATDSTDTAAVGLTGTCTISNTDGTGVSATFTLTGAGWTFLEGRGEHNEGTATSQCSSGSGVGTQSMTVTFASDENIEFIRAIRLVVSHA